MAVTIMRNESATKMTSFSEAPNSRTISELNNGDEAEVLEFLAANPLHTVFMASQIRDNGISSHQNRGTFYRCRNRGGQLEAVALIGHATLIDARTQSSLAAFARMTGNCLNVHLIRGEQETINNFWKHYANSGQKPRLTCRELLFEQKAAAKPEGASDLRPATFDDLNKVMAVNASMALQEAGTNPLQKDPGGFRSRTARRIEQGRVWVWTQDDRLIFKADVVAQTPQVTYLEGVHIHAEERRQGYGLRCLRNLSAMLLERTESICLTVNEKNKTGIKFYEKAGYQFHSHYETIYLRY
jgi:predicted GNAT family acetyltransferase